MSLDFSSTIAALNFLLNLYRLRHERNKTEESDPDPQALKDVIAELEAGPQSEDAGSGVDAHLDARLRPDQAQRVKEDLFMVRAIGGPPDMSKRDYWTVLSNYATALQTLAVRFEVFKIFGATQEGVRAVPLRETGTALLPIDIAEANLSNIESHAVGRVIWGGGLLLEQSPGFPISPAIEAIWAGRSYGYGSSDPQMKRFAIYTVHPGQDRNWLTFKSDDYYFSSFQRRLHAEDVKNIMAAMKREVFEYLARVEAEDPTLDEIHLELSDLLGRVHKQNSQ